MLQKNKPHILIFWITLLVILFLDYTTKQIAIQYLQEPVVLIENILQLKLLYNTGIAFSLPLTGLPLKIITIILIGVLFHYYYKYEQPKNSYLIDIAFAGIIGGAIGNAVERIIHGSVVDFIALRYFAVFNIADIMITTGALLLIYSYFKYPLWD